MAGAFVRQLLTRAIARQFLTIPLRNVGYVGEAAISGAAIIYVGYLSMSDKQNNETTYLFVTKGSRAERGGRV
jgi:hypothetical protein